MTGKPTRFAAHGRLLAALALHLVAGCWLRYCDRACAYAERRTAGGKSKREVRGCVKRYIAREVYNALHADLAERLRDRPAKSSRSCAALPASESGPKRS